MQYQNRNISFRDIKEFIKYLAWNGANWLVSLITPVFMSSYLGDLFHIPLFSHLETFRITKNWQSSAMN